MTRPVTSKFTARTFTGRHMAAIIVSFFAVVVSVNLLMARFAIGTFGGVVVDNAYVASQHYNRWLDEAAKEAALGWSAKVVRQPGGGVAIAVAGLPQGPATVAAVARHPLGRQPDQALVFSALGGGRFASVKPLPAGRWLVRFHVRSGDQLWRTEAEVL